LQDIDLIKAIGLAADFNVEFRSMPLDGIIPALQSKTVDGAVSAMTINAERSKTVSFSTLFQSWLAIATQADNKDITSLDSLKNKRSPCRSAQPAQLRQRKSLVLRFVPLIRHQLLFRNYVIVMWMPSSDAPAILPAIKYNLGLKISEQLLTEEYYGIPNSLPRIPDQQGFDNYPGQWHLRADYQKWFDAKPHNYRKRTI